MRGLSRMAFLMGLVAMTAAPLNAAQAGTTADETETEVFVINNHLVDVRVFAEDADGKLHKLGRVARGQLGTFDIPGTVSGESFRIKVFPTSPVWSPVPDDFGVKTNPIDARRDRQVRVWLEADLARSMVEIERG